MKVMSVDTKRHKFEANQRCLTEEGKALLKIRGQTIERPFAVIKDRYGLRRFKLRGPSQAAIEFGLAVLAFNVHILAGYLRHPF